MSLIVAGSGLTGPAALLASYRSRARCAAYVHGLDIVARHPVYRWLWMPLLGRLDAAFANSASTAELARHAGVARGNVLVLNPGTEFPELTTPDANEFRDDYKVGDGPMLLSVGRLTERKGLREFIELAMPKIVAAYPTAKLVVIGDDATNALHQGNAHVASRVMEEVASQGLHANVVRLGPCDDETLHRAYLEADVHVFPVRDVPGDIEGFGMVAVEAAARGLPTVAFPVGGVSDAVSDGVSGYLPTPGDYDGFAARVCQVLAEGRAGRLRGSARNFARQFAWDCFGERLRRMADEVADA